MPVLGTKLRVPIPRRQLVPRARLLRHLDGDPGSAPRLILVTAPAGFGKTTLLSQWLSAEPGPAEVAWVSLDAGDSDPQVFFSHLVASTQRVLPGVGDEALGLLEADRGTRLAEVAASYVNDLDTVAGSLVLALDDYHVIDSQAVHDAVAFLVENLPPGITVAMTTRVDPPLPVARMRARGELHEVRAADLRFTKDEAAAFLNDVMGLGVDGSLVEALEAKTEGWAAGLQMAALSARGRTRGATAGDAGIEEFVEDFTGTHRFVLDYLLEEVLEGQPEEIRRFLLHTAVLDQLTAPLCGALTDHPDAQQVLETLERDNVFLVPLDDERRWFRYHHLFAEVLRARLLAEEPDQTSRLHRTASVWYAEHGSVADAIGHALAAGDFELAGDLIELALPAGRSRREDRTLSAWLHALPEDVIRQRPLLSAQQAWARLSEGDLDGATRWLDHADATLSASATRSDDDASRQLALDGRLAEAARERSNERRALPAQIAVFRASVAQARGDIAATATHARRALELAGPEDYLARSGGAGFLGLASWAAGDLVTAVETFTVAVHALREGGHLTDELGTTVVLAQMWCARGEPARARRLYEESLRRAQEHPERVLSTVGDLHVGLADVLREQGALDAADEHLAAAQALGDRASLPENRHRWFAVKAAMQAARGDFDGAVTSLEKAQELYQPGFFPDIRPLAATRARARIAQGRLEDAQVWAEQHRAAIGGTRGTPVRATPEPDSFVTEYARLTWVRLLIARHHVRAASRKAPAGVLSPQGGATELGEALAELDRIVAAGERADRGGTVVEARWLRALAHHADGNEAAAIDDAAEALTLGVPAGYVRLFLDEGAAARDLLDVVIRHVPHAADAAATVLAVADHASTEAAPASPAGPESRAPSATRPASAGRGLTTTPTGTDAGAEGSADPQGLRAQEPLSERELEVLGLLDSELTGPEIAEHLFMSINTFRTHTRHIFTKLDVNTRRAAVQRAKALNLV